MIDPNIRKQDETQESFRHRRIDDKNSYKVFRQGNIIWDSNANGTYVKAKHGPIGTVKE